jgi:tRNA nucleotidyltransferase (CCA-adding enzyme)
VALLERCDAWRRPARLESALAAFIALSEAAPPTPNLVARRCEQVRAALQAAQRVSSAALPATVRDAAGPALGQALREARLQAIANNVEWS